MRGVRTSSRTRTAFDNAGPSRGIWSRPDGPADLSRALLYPEPGQNHQTTTISRPQDGSCSETLVLYRQTAAAFSSRLSGAAFCTTDRGYAGLVPAHASVGDEICLFHGGRGAVCAAPFVSAPALSRWGNATFMDSCRVKGCATIWRRRCLFCSDFPRCLETAMVT